MQYEKEVVYSLQVTGTMIIGDKYYYLIENEGIKYKVKMLKFQQKLPVPDEVKCIVYAYDADNTPLFAQYKGDIAHKLYTVGSTYPFVLHKKTNYQSEHRNIFYGYDMNGIQATIQAGIGKELTIGTTIRCTVKHIYPEGNLLVVPISQEMDKETNFLTFAQLTHNIHSEGLPACIQLDTLRSEAVSDSKIQQMLKQYDNREGEWLLSFLNILLAKREEKIDRKEWEEVCELINIQRLLIEWVLEDSLFLAFYSPSIVQSLREKGEREILVCEAIGKAIELIRTNAVEDFLEHIFAKIHTSGYLSDRNRKIELLVALFRLDDTLVDKNETALTEFCQYVASTTSDTGEPVLMSVVELIKRIIEKNRTKGNPSPARTVQLLAISLLLCDNRDANTLLIQRIMLYRHAALASPASARILINKAYDALTQTNQIYSPEFTWDDVVHFKPDLFIAKLRSFIINEGDKLIARHITKGSRVLLCNGTFTLYAGCNPDAILPEHQKVTEILSVFDRKINIYAKKDIKPKSNDLENVLVLKSFWEGLYGQLSRQTIPSTNKTSVKMLPSEGTRLKITLKPFNSRYPLMMFAEITEPGYKGSGALMANEVSRLHIQSMNDLFYEGDTFEATVLKIGQNERLTFGIARELFEFVTGTVKFGQRVYAKLVHISKGTCIWVCEDGYSLFSPGKTPYPEIGTVALMEIRDINNAGYINAAYIEEADESVQIEETEALGKLIGEYINFCSPPEEEMEEEEGNFGKPFTDEDTMQTEVQLSLPLIHELSWLLAVTANSENSLVTRYNLLGAARLLTTMINDSELNEYVSLLMNYEENIYSFATHNGQGRWTNFSRIDDAAVSHYPSLEPKKELLRILSSFYSHTFDSELAVGIATTKDPNREHIIRLVLAHALLFQTLTVKALTPLRNELLQRIGAGDFVVPDESAGSSLVPEQKEELSCLGRENEKAEFKSSIVYPAGNTVPDMKQQSDIILRTIAGFLNAAGGTLYIGVSNAGLAIGLREDYSYMVCDSDGYERFIRQHGYSYANPRAKEGIAYRGSARIREDILCNSILPYQWIEWVEQQRKSNKQISQSNLPIGELYIKQITQDWAVQDKILTYLLFSKLLDKIILECPFEEVNTLTAFAIRNSNLLTDGTPELVIAKEHLGEEFECKSQHEQCDAYVRELYVQEKDDTAIVRLSTDSIIQRLDGNDTLCTAADYRKLVAWAVKEDERVRLQAGLDRLSEDMEKQRDKLVSMAGRNLKNIFPYLFSGDNVYYTIDDSEYRSFGSSSAGRTIYPFTGSFWTYGMKTIGKDLCPNCNNRSGNIKKGIGISVVHYRQLMWLCGITDRNKLPPYYRNYMRHDLIPYHGNTLLDNVNPTYTVKDPCSDKHSNGFGITFCLCGYCLNKLKKQYRKGKNIKIHFSLNEMNVTDIEVVE